jgi:hypothetical protein
LGFSSATCATGSSGAGGVDGDVSVGGRTVGSSTSVRAPFSRDAVMISSSSVSVGADCVCIVALAVGGRGCFAKLVDSFVDVSNDSVGGDASSTACIETSVSSAASSVSRRVGGRGGGFGFFAGIGTDGRGGGGSGGAAGSRWYVFIASNGSSGSGVSGLVASVVFGGGGTAKLASVGIGFGMTGGESDAVFLRVGGGSVVGLPRPSRSRSVVSACGTLTPAIVSGRCASIDAGVGIPAIALI